MDGNMESLVDACKASGTILMVTGDHGMSFPNDSGRGAHEAADVASRKESLMTPLLIFSNKTLKGTGGTYGQECLSPTLLSLLDEPDTMSLADGYPLPVKENPTLYLRSETPENVTVTGNNYNVTVPVSGIYRLDGLENGDYTVSGDNDQINLHLAYDKLIVLTNEHTQNNSALPTWAIYLAIAVFAIIGISVALIVVYTRK